MSTIGKYVFWALSILITAAGVEIARKVIEEVSKKAKEAKEMKDAAEELTEL
jgi:hypothetical protein